MSRREDGTAFRLTGVPNGTAMRASQLILPCLTPRSGGTLPAATQCPIPTTGYQCSGSWTPCCPSGSSPTRRRCRTAYLVRMSPFCVRRASEDVQWTHACLPRLSAIFSGSYSFFSPCRDCCSTRWVRHAQHGDQAPAPAVPGAREDKGVRRGQDQTHQAVPDGRDGEDELGTPENAQHR